jgi:hypothetical protein
VATLEEGVNQVLRNCGGPPADVLSFEEATDFYLSALDYYLQMLTGSDNFQASGASVPFVPPTKIGQVGGQFPSTIPGYVEVQASADRDIWSGISIVNVDDINDFEGVGRRAIAFYGQPVQYRLSWDPTLHADTLRLWYSPDSLGAQTLQDTPPLPRTFFQNMVPMRATVIDALAQLILKDPTRYQAFVSLKMGTYSNQLQQWDEQFKSFVYENKDLGPIEIEAYNAGRDGHGDFALNYYPWDV